MDIDYFLYLVSLYLVFIFYFFNFLRVPMLNIFNRSKRFYHSIVALYSNILIDEIGAGLVGLFMPIFLWEKFGRLDYVLYYYLAIHGLFSVLVICGAMIMSKIGQKMSMILSVPFKILFYFCLYYIAIGYSVFWFSILMIAVIEIQMMLFWVPYHTDFARFTNRKTRGRTISWLYSVSSLAAVTLPFLSGWIIANYGFNVLFLIAIILVTLSVVPLFFISPTYEKFSFSFWETWRQFFRRDYRRVAVSFFATGVENTVGLIIWPVFIFQLLQGDFLKVGYISSLIVLSTIMINLIIGFYADKFNKRLILKYGTALYALGWFFKTFVATAFQIFVTSAYHNFAAVAIQTPFNALVYEKAADAGHYVDELTVIREMALNLGRAFGIILLLVMINFVGLEWAFILAAVASLFMNLI